MPCVVRHFKHHEKPWAGVNKDTGKVYGHSKSKAKAQAMCNAINGAKHGWTQSASHRVRGKPTGKKAK